MTEGAAEVGNRVMKQLEDAWNDANGEAFGAPFTEDAVFVNIRGEHHTGRTAIARGHQAIFDSIYRGSVNRYEALVVKRLGDDVLYVLGHATLHAPTGPMAGDHESHFSVVMSRRDDSDWQVDAFHNTLIAPPPGG
jgi:uncharacterized protein (TIGR02246 family)